VKVGESESWGERWHAPTPPWVNGYSDVDPCKFADQIDQTLLLPPEPCDEQSKQHGWLLHWSGRALDARQACIESSGRKKGEEMGWGIVGIEGGQKDSFFCFCLAAGGRREQCRICVSNIYASLFRDRNHDIPGRKELDFSTNHIQSLKLAQHHSALPHATRDLLKHVS
jgi:hypothetical protein